MLKNRIYLWDNMKVLLMMLVVMTHSICIYQSEGDDWVPYLWIFTMTFTMPLFTMISGFWYKPRKVSYGMKRYLFPCVLFSVVNMFWGGVNDAYPNGIVLTKSGYAMWYLWALFLYNVLTPYALKRMNEKTLLLVSLVLAFMCGFKFLGNNILDVQRVVNFYPFFVMGIMMKKHGDWIYTTHTSIKLRWLAVFVLATLAYVSFCLKWNGFCYGTGFMNGHGLSMRGVFMKWMNYILVVAMSLAVIKLVPNRKFRFSQYGSRTMNVYMLHMIVVFLLSWNLLKPVMYEWYGYILYVVAVPMLCLFLYSDFIDAFMNRILELPDHISKTYKNQVRR